MDHKRAGGGQESRKTDRFVLGMALPLLDNFESVEISGKLLRPWKDLFETVAATVDVVAVIVLIAAVESRALAFGLSACGSHRDEWGMRLVGPPLVFVPAGRAVE